MVNLNDLRNQALKMIREARDVKTLEALRIKFLGREQGELTQILRSLKDLSINERRKLGPVANSLRQEIEKLLSQKLEELKTKSQKSLPGIDVSMPGKKVAVGHLHILTTVEKQIREVFKAMNFSVVEGPEIETEHYNFDALNIPKDHPARDMWDTFWIKPKTQNQNSKLLLRTHTSPMQIRYMETHKPPFQIIVPGRVFRYEATDTSHEINFYQVEGLMVGKDVNLANFKFVIEEFFRRLFGRDIKVRFRPGYFPFVEPGLEVDLEWKGRWLEIMGAGMVHPKVFAAAHYNPRELQGFAFGLGLERIAMIKYNIPDIRMFYNGDLRFIKQF